jgi:hypothetical protein
MEDKLMEKIKNLICEKEGISPAIIFKKTRIVEIKEARQIIQHFICKYVFPGENNTAELRKVGAYCGNQDRCTVMHSKQVVNDLYYSDKKFKAKIDDYDLDIRVLMEDRSLEFAVELQRQIKNDLVKIREKQELVADILKIAPSEVWAENDYIQ